jgi:hypothetical protein
MTALDAEYAACPIWPSNAATDAVFIITPRSPSPFGVPFAIAAAAKRIMLNVPIRLIEMHRENESSRCGASFLPRTCSPIANACTIDKALKAPGTLGRELHSQGLPDTRTGTGDSDHFPIEHVRLSDPSRRCQTSIAGRNTCAGALQPNSSHHRAYSPRRTNIGDHRNARA